MKRILTRYLPAYSTAVLYMLQNTEYRLRDFWKWYWQVNDWRKVTDKGQLVLTPAASALLAGLVLIHGLLYLYVVVALFTIEWTGFGAGLLLGLFILAWLYALPLMAVICFSLVIAITKQLIQKPYQTWRVAEAKRIFRDSPATVIAIAGSYGKTTMKHVLFESFGASAKVAATPGNLNTPIGLSRFARALNGDEDILIVELGEYQMGDVHKLCSIVGPDIGIVTGINEQHGAVMGPLENAVQTIFEIESFVPEDKLYINDESRPAKERRGEQHIGYSAKGCGPWKVSAIKAGLTGSSFTLKKSSKSYKLSTRLLGRHQVGPLSCVVALADTLGLDIDLTIKAIETIPSFHNRFDPVTFPDGSVVIYDIYNGNPDGFRAGIDFLSDLPKKDYKRRVYVTPGMIELGPESERIHREVARSLATSPIEEIMFVKNSHTAWMLDELQKVSYKGTIREVDDGLELYKNIDAYTRPGDVVLLQNSPREDFFYS